MLLRRNTICGAQRKVNNLTVKASDLVRWYSPGLHLREKDRFRARSLVEKASSSAVQIERGTKKKKYTSALLFDCDGVIVETEELHRKAYNAAFEEFRCTINGQPLVWNVEYYDVLQNTVGGGKPKMKYHFKINGWPDSTKGPAPITEEAQNLLVDNLQDKKTEHYKRIVTSAAEARPGILELMDEGLSRPDIAMCICSAATKEGFVQVVNSIVKPERLERFDVILAGDDVTRKKPDPLIYNMTREKLGLPADRCVVIEDSLVGLRAAVGAGMKCIITPTASTSSADFIAEGATAVVSAMAGPGFKVTIDDIFSKDDEGVMVPNIRIKTK
jgi:HAD superfamily hydrolase (TIGR01509 family)